MAIQSTQCASEELAELEEWLKAKGMTFVDRSDGDPRPGEYTKTLNEPEDAASGGSPTWKVTWHTAD